MILAEYIKPGDTAIDCTAGNGSDTLFLVKAVGPAGRVLAFDVQKDALDITRELMEQKGVVNVELINDSNAKIEEYAKGLSEGEDGPTVIMYNLGYLPGGDHSITTNTEETLTSLERALRILAAGGVVSLVTYPGHPEGEREELAISKYLEELPASAFEILTIKQTNRTKAPVLHLIKKK